MLRKNFLCGILFICFVFVMISNTFCCTSFYVGSKVSQSGRMFYGRCSDTHPLLSPSKLEIYGGDDGIKLTELVGINNFKYVLNNKHYRFIASTTDEIVADTLGHYYTFALNEKGVSISATLTGYSSPTSLQYNPYVKDGLCEDVMPYIVGAEASTALEGIKIISKIIDEKGSAEDNILVIADQKEAWYMEIYGGHQYCAIKLPEDKVSVYGNEFMLECVDSNDTKNVICSKDLFSLPKKYGFAEYDNNGAINLFDTYAGKGRIASYANRRTWMGHKLFANSTAGDFVENKKYPLFFKPDKKISLEEAMDLFRNRYEGTEFDANEYNNNDLRVIGTETQTKVHIIEVYDDAPSELANVAWVTLSQAEFNCYVPINSFENKIDSNYTNELQKLGYDKNNNYMVSKYLNTLGALDRKNLGEGIKSFWKEYEKSEIKNMQRVMNEAINLAKTNKKEARNLINNFCTKVQNNIHNETLRLIEEVKMYEMNTVDTLKDKFVYAELKFYPNEIEKFKAEVDENILKQFDE